MAKKPTYKELEQRVKELKNEAVERKRTEEALKNAQQELEAVLDAAPASIWRKDIEGKYLQVNQRYCDTVGLSKEGVIGKTDYELYPEEIAEKYLQNDRSVIATGTSQYGLTERHITPSGRVGWCLSNKIASRDHRGNVVGTIGFALDTTAVIMAEEALREGQERLRTIANTALDSIFSKDLNRRYTFVNKAMVQLMGCTEADLIGKVPEEVFDKEDAAIVNEVDERTLNGENISEIRSLSIAGKTHVFHTIQVPLLDPDGNIMGISGIVRDNTDSMKILEALRESEEKHRLLFESAGDAIFIHDAEGRILSVNPIACEMLGYTHSELMSMTVANVDTPEEAQNAPDRIARLMVQGHLAFETVHRHKDGSTIPIEVSARLITWDGQPMTMSICRDITERKRAEEVVLKKNEILAGINRIFETVVTSGTDEEFGATCLDVIEAVTDSNISFLGEIGPDGLFYEIAVSNPGREACSPLSLQGGSKPPRKFRTHGIYGRVLLEGKTLIMNDPSSHPDIIGFPKGHPPLNSFLGVPLKQAGQTVGMIAVGNRKGGYSSEQRKALEVLSPAISETLARRRAVRALHRSEELHRATMANLPGGAVFVLDSNLRYILAEGQGLESAGFLSADFEGRTIWEAPDAPITKHHETLVCQALLGSGAQQEHKSRDRWYMSECVPIRNQKGVETHSIILSYDITMRKDMEEFLRKARDELEIRVRERTAELEERVAQLARLSLKLTLAEQKERRRIAAILHDHIQQLLVGAKLNQELLINDLDDSRKTEATRVLDLINRSIMDMRSLSTELSPHVLQSGDFTAALKWLAGWMREYHGLEIDYEPKERIMIDKKDLAVLSFQSVRELLLNALKHSGETTVELKTDCINENLRITIRDQGKGFDPETVWNQLELRQTFGLFSIRERLQLLGGRLEIESAPNEGSTISLIVPMEKRRTTSKKFRNPKAPGKPVPNSPSSKRSSEKIRVLVVDDHPVVREGLASMVASHVDLEIVGEASDGEEAVRLALKLVPDAILMDIAMPNMDGVQATRIIHSEFPHIRIIGLSTYDDDGQTTAMLNAGALVYRSKGVKKEELISLIRRDGQ